MPRKGENIYKRKDGRWEGRYIKKRDIKHKAVYGYLYGKSYTEVKNKLKQAKLQKTVNSIQSANFGQIVDDWLRNKKLRVKESTLSRYKTIIDKHIYPLLGQYDISEVSTNIIQQYINELICGGYSNKTVGDILTVIKSILKYATCKGLEHTCDLSIVNLKSQKSDIQTLTLFEQKKLCDYLITNIDNRNFGILLCLYTGIRIGELCALKWSDIDIREKVLKIDKTMLRIQDNCSKQKDCKTKVIITPPKSDDSIRTIPIPNFLFTIILTQKRNPNAYILTGESNWFLEPRNMQYYFKTVLKECGIRDVKFHILRHTFATRCVENGFEIKSLSEILGHSSIKITLDRYVHSSMELKRKNMDKLNFLSA